MEHRYLSDIIGEEFLQWQPGDIVYMSTPTGSGKTSFILNNLLPHCAMRQEKILYLVNRSALKKQIDSIIHSEVPPNFWNCITVELYQSIESELTNLVYGEIYSDYYWGYREALSSHMQENCEDELLGPKFKCNGYACRTINQTRLKKYKDYKWIISDESHYFYADSLFNTSTTVSYHFIQRNFYDKIRIFMSATIEEIQQRIMLENKANHLVRTEIYNLHIPSLTLDTLRHREFVYSTERNYDYINIEIVYNESEIPPLVIESKSKWLIFVDSIEKGKSLKQEILSKNKELEIPKTVEFITKDYALDADTALEMNNIVKKNKQKADILIATSVLDNGVNLQDGELRNLIVMADNETEFIQMVGRKRTDGFPVTVYLYKYDREHFAKRYRDCDKKFTKAYEYYVKLESIVKYSYNNGQNDTPTIDEVNSYERALVESEHKHLLQKLMRGELSFNELRTSFFEYNGVLLLNTLSMSHLLYLRNYYKQIMEKFDYCEEFSFCKEQLRWLQKPEICLVEASKNSIERAREAVIRGIENAMDENERKNSGKKDYIARNVLKYQFFAKKKENMLSSILEVFTVCKDLPKYNAVVKELKKNDRHISKNQMDLLRQYCGIPYYVHCENGYCTITHASEIEKKGTDDSIN